MQTDKQLVRKDMDVNEHEKPINLYTWHTN